MQVIFRMFVTVLLFSGLALAEFSKQDLSEIFESGTKVRDENGNWKRTIKFKRKYENKFFSMSSKVSHYYNSTTYSILWIKIDENSRVGCLASANNKEFDNFTIGDTVTVQRKIHHIQLDFNGKFSEELVLSHGCTVSK